MYVKVEQAVVWVDGPAGAKRRHPPRPKRIQRRAIHPLHTSQGLGRELRFEDNKASVRVGATGQCRWVPLERLANEAQARRWIETGFPREG